MVVWVCVCFDGMFLIFDIFVADEARNSRIEACSKTPCKEIMQKRGEGEM